MTLLVSSTPRFGSLEKRQAFAEAPMKTEGVQKLGDPELIERRVEEAVTELLSSGRLNHTAIEGHGVPISLTYADILKGIA